MSAPYTNKQAWTIAMPACCMSTSQIREEYAITLAELRRIESLDPYYECNDFDDRFMQLRCELETRGLKP